MQGMPDITPPGRSGAGPEPGPEVKYCSCSSPCRMPGTFVCIAPDILKSRYSVPHFAEGEAVTQRGEVASPRSQPVS